MDLTDDDVRLYTPLVASRARRFLGVGRGHLDDFMSAGYIGLVKAAKYFDPDAGAAFASYAVHLIDGEIRHYIRDHLRLIRIPGYLIEQDSDSDYPTTVSLDSIEDNDEFIAGDADPIDIDALAMCLAVDKLPERQRLLIRQRFYADKVVDEVAADMGISPTQVCRLTRLALERLAGLAE